MGARSEKVRRGYEAFGEGDFDGALGLLADDFVWQGPESERVPGSGTHRGQDEVKRLWQRMGSSVEDLRVEPDEFIEGEDTVTVLGHTSGRGRSEFKVPFVHVWRFEGETPTRVQTLTDTAVVADALGN